MWRHLADWMTTGVLLLMLLLWQHIPGSESCASRTCHCFFEGDIDCVEIYVKRVPRFQRSADNATVNYTLIDLSKNKLRTLDRRSFRNISVLSIKIWENRGPLRIDRKALRPLRNVLQIISFRKNNITELPSGLFRRQRQLKHIELSRNNISIIHRDVFRGASTVEVLNLERNRLERLQENVFAGLKNLQELKLARNQLVLIDPTAFRALGQLETLDLKANRLRDLIDLIHVGRR